MEAMCRQVAMDMKAQGMYVCRTLSFAGTALPLGLSSMGHDTCAASM